MSKHTTTPWFYREKQGVIFNKIDGPLGGSIDGVGVAFDVSPTDAAYILKCVNMHEELVEALKNALSVLNHSDFEELHCECGYFGESQHTCLRCWRDDALKAIDSQILAKAKGDE